MIYVYIHTVPNGKVYIGQTANPVDRWVDGEGYNDNIGFYNDIKKYGWNNIKHEILKECETRSEAIMYEMSFILLANSENKDYGYNQTSWYKDCNELLKNKKPYIPHNITERGWNKRNIFVDSGLSTIEVAEIIDKYVFSERDRKILKRRLIDDITYAELVKEFNTSERQLKQICIKWQEHIKQFI